MPEVLIEVCFVGVAHPDIKLAALAVGGQKLAAFGDPEPFKIFREGEAGIALKDTTEIGGVVVAEGSQLCSREAFRIVLIDIFQDPLEFMGLL